MESRATQSRPPAGQGQPLDALARQYGTDKSTAGHCFTPVYERVLKDLRCRPVTLLEIGVGGGGSLRMWREYFNRGRVVGIDSRQKRQHAGERITIHIGRQENSAFLERVAKLEGPFDIIIDDGGHWAHQQKVSLRHLWPHLSPGGIYAIEDVHTSYSETYEMGWRHPETTVEFLKYVVDDVHAGIHRRDVTLTNLESIHFYSELCVLRRSSATDS